MGIILTGIPRRNNNTQLRLVVARQCPLRLTRIQAAQIKFCLRILNECSSDLSHAAFRCVPGRMTLLWYEDVGAVFQLAIRGLAHVDGCGHIVCALQDQRRHITGHRVFHLDGRCDNRPTLAAACVRLRYDQVRQLRELQIVEAVFRILKTFVQDVVGAVNRGEQERSGLARLK